MGLTLALSPCLHYYGHCSILVCRLATSCNPEQQQVAMHMVLTEAMGEAEGEAAMVVVAISDIGLTKPNQKALATLGDIIMTFYQDAAWPVISCFMLATVCVCKPAFDVVPQPFRISIATILPDTESQLRRCQKSTTV